MASRDEIGVVYGASLMQGVALVTFPAASAVFTSPSEYGLSSFEYGGMFVPQAITSIAAALLTSGLTRRLGAKRIYRLGLAANLSAMALLVLSRLVMKEHSLAYGVLLIATGCLGAGLGFTAPTLNTFAAAFFPLKVDRAVLTLNALLGSGTALAPVFIALFVGLGVWWGLPVLVGTLILGLLVFSVKLPLSEGAAPVGAPVPRPTRLPPRFWLFAAFALLYGACETMNGNWASLYMKQELGASTTQASLALAAFWGMLTAGRVLFAAIEKWFPERAAFRVLPLIVLSGFAAAALLGKVGPDLGIVVFGLAGLGCSALLPLVISFGEEEFRSMTASVAGGLIASCQIGYGIAAFGVGPLQTRGGLSLNTIYGAATAAAVALAIFAWLVTRRPAEPVPQTQGSRSPSALERK